MERELCWALFWQTGLPVAWLLSRRGDRPGALAAFAAEESGGTAV